MQVQLFIDGPWRGNVFYLMIWITEINKLFDNIPVYSAVPLYTEQYWKKTCKD